MKANVIDTGIGNSLDRDIFRTQAKILSKHISLESPSIIHTYLYIHRKKAQIILSKMEL